MVRSRCFQYRQFSQKFQILNFINFINIIRKIFFKKIMSIICDNALCQLYFDFEILKTDREREY